VLCTIANVSINHHQYSNCAQDTFVTYLLHYKKEYIKIFDHTWSFKFVKKAYIDINIYRDEFAQLFESLLLNYGVMVIQNHDISNIYEVKKSLENDVPVIIFLDTYYCSWHKSYQISHSEHFVLWVGCDDEHIYCIDPYYSRKIEILDTEKYKKAAIKLFFLFENKVTIQPWAEVMHKKALPAK
jgi:hypothetical protein